MIWSTAALVLSRRLEKERKWLKTWAELIDVSGKIFGPDCLMVAAAKVEQGRLELASARWAAAIQLFDEAAKILTEAAGPQSLRLGNALAWKGQTALYSGNLLLAEKSLRAAHEILSPLQRVAAADYHFCLGMYAIAALRLRDFERAEALLGRQRASAERVFGKESRQYAVAVFDFGDYCTALHNVKKAEGAHADASARHKQAEAAYREASAIHLKIAGDNSRAYADSLLALANCCRTGGDAVVALPLYQQALAIFQKLDGAESPLVADVMLDRGRMRLNGGDLKQAEEDIRGAADIHKKQRGAGSERAVRKVSAVPGRSGFPTGRCEAGRGVLPGDSQAPGTSRRTARRRPNRRPAACFGP